MTAPARSKPSTDVAVVKSNMPAQIEELFASDAAARYVTPFLPEGVDAKRVAASVMLAIRQDKTGKLGQCTPISLVLGVARIQQWGLELGVTAYLLPFKDKEAGTMEATPCAGYNGLCELMIASGAVRYVEARAVYKGDGFRYKLGMDPMLEHEPVGLKSERGPIVYAYCIVHLPFGRKAFEVMDARDIDAIRLKFSKQWKDGPLPAWYAKKTVVRQTAKMLPKNPKLAQFFAVLEQDRAVEVEDDPAPGLARITSMRDEEDEDDDEPNLPRGRQVASVPAKPITADTLATAAHAASQPDPYEAPTPFDDDDRDELRFLY